MNGLGRMIWFSAGKMYYGNYVNNKKHGLGVFFWGFKKKWAGFWKDGLRDGPGILILNDNIREREVWEKGKKVEIFNQSHKQDELYKAIEDFCHKSENDFDGMQT